VTVQQERIGIENNWYALIGRVVAVKVEADGDLHIALSDATGDKPGIVVVEIPLGPQWCAEIIVNLFMRSGRRGLTRSPKSIRLC